MPVEIAPGPLPGPLPSRCQHVPPCSVQVHPSEGCTHSCQNALKNATHTTTAPLMVCHHGGGAPSARRAAASGGMAAVAPGRVLGYQGGRSGSRWRACRPAAGGGGLCCGHRVNDVEAAARAGGGRVAQGPQDGELAAMAGPEISLELSRAAGSGTAWPCSLACRWMLTTALAAVAPSGWRCRTHPLMASLTATLGTVLDRSVRLALHIVQQAALPPPPRVPCCHGRCRRRRPPPLTRLLVCCALRRSRLLGHAHGIVGSRPSSSTSTTRRPPRCRTRCAHT